MWVFARHAFGHEQAESILVPDALTNVVKTTFGLRLSLYPVPSLVMILGHGARRDLPFGEPLDGAAHLRDWAATRRPVATRGCGLGKTSRVYASRAIELIEHHRDHDRAADDDPLVVLVEMLTGG